MHIELFTYNLVVVSLYIPILYFGSDRRKGCFMKIMLKQFKVIMKSDIAWIVVLVPVFG